MNSVKAFAIVIDGNPISEAGWTNLKASSEKFDHNIELERYHAYTPKQAFEFMSDSNTRMRWTWPWVGEEIDFATGIKKRAYVTNNPHARVACFLSHYCLWKKAVSLEEPILILEHDALFIRPFDTIGRDDAVISINDPRGATRKSQLYHEILQTIEYDIVTCPYIDPDRSIAQGLPGNSAYIIGPELAYKAIDFTHKHGMWPNDALLCNQNFPGKLFCYSRYVTRVQGLQSTTTQ